MVTAGGRGGAVLTLDAALDGCGAGVVAGGVVLAEEMRPGGRGSAAVLPALAAAVLAAADVRPEALGGIAVTVGPGSFTGVRAALALAHGIGLAAGRPVWGVTIGAALRAGCGALGGRALWVAVDSRRGRVFLDRGGVVVSVALTGLPMPDGAVAVAGDAAVAVASRLAARGCDVRLLAERRATAAGIAAAERGAALPMYVDPPEARAGAGARPAPGLASYQP